MVGVNEGEVHKGETAAAVELQGSGSPPIGQLSWDKGPAVAVFPAASVELTEYS